MDLPRVISGGTPPASERAARARQTPAPRQMPSTPLSPGTPTPPARGRRKLWAWIVTLGLLWTALAGAAAFLLWPHDEPGAPTKEFVAIYVTDQPIDYERIDLLFGLAQVEGLGLPLGQSVVTITNLHGAEEAVPLAWGYVAANTEAADVRLVLLQVDGWVAGVPRTIPLPEEGLVVPGAVAGGSHAVKMTILDFGLAESLVDGSFRPSISAVYRFVDETPFGRMPTREELAQRLDPAQLGERLEETRDVTVEREDVADEERDELCRAQPATCAPREEDEDRADSDSDRGEGDESPVYDGPDPPTTPNHPSPSDEATSNSVTALRWRGGDPDPDDDVEYRVLTGSSASALTQRCAWAASSVCSELTFATGTWYWRVESRDGRHTVQGPVWEFTIDPLAANQPPDAPTDPSPTDQDGVAALSVELQWDAQDGDGDALTFLVKFALDGDALSTACSNLVSASCTVNDLVDGATYDWQVTSSDDEDATVGPTWRFTVDLGQDPPGENQPPSAPSLASPADGATTDPGDVTLQWSAASDPDGDSVIYTVYFEAADATPDVKAPGCSETTATSCVVASSLGGPHYWNVVANDGQGHDVSSATRSFTWAVDANDPPDGPEAYSPGDGAVDVPTSVELEWTAQDPDAGDTLEFEVYFGVGNANGQLCTWQSENSCPTPDLSYATEYVWRVNVRDNHGSIAQGPTWSFTTECEPGTCGGLGGF